MEIKADTSSNPPMAVLSGSDFCGMRTASRRLSVAHVLCRPLDQLNSGPSPWVRLWRQCTNRTTVRLPVTLLRSQQHLPVGRCAGVLVLLQFHTHHVEELIWVRAQVMHQIQEVLHRLLHNDCALPRTQRGHRFRSCFFIQVNIGKTRKEVEIMQLFQTLKLSWEGI